MQKLGNPTNHRTRHTWARCSSSLLGLDVRAAIRIKPMHYDRKFDLRLFVVRHGYDAVDYGDGPPLLEHFKTIDELQAFLLTHGIDIDRVVEAASLLAQGKDTTVYGPKPS
jgi:hypothetical protein